MKLALSLAALLFLSAPAMLLAVEIENVILPDSIPSTTSTKSLVLNGAGIRTKLFFDIYVCGLYLETKSQKPADIIRDTGEKRIMMHFLYDEVSREKLVSGWTDGFEANHTDKQMAKLKVPLANFNAMFSTVKKGNTIQLDFLSNGEVHVTINGSKKGFVQGNEFQQGLLRIWLGEEPVTDDLKSAMLGIKQE